MKKTMIIAILSIFTLTTYSCKKEVKNVTKETANTKSYTLNPEDINITWTGYKTSEKIPVKGTFKEVKLLNAIPADSPVKILRNLKFSIPVARIYSKDSIRDYKLVNFLFGNMASTINITGVITLDDNGKGTSKLSLNGLEKTIPLTYKNEGNHFEIHGTMDLNDWKAQAAVSALNAVCSEKHKSKDGISKTWSDVAIDISVKTQESK